MSENLLGFVTFYYFPLARISMSLFYFDYNQFVYSNQEVQKYETVQT